MSTYALVALVLLIGTGVSVLCAVLVSRGDPVVPPPTVCGEVGALFEVGHVSLDLTTGAFNIYMYKEEMSAVIDSIGDNGMASLYVGPLTNNTGTTTGNTTTSTTAREDMI